MHDELTSHLREMIIGGGLKPGNKIPEQLLCERFEISRTPLREALKVLASEGLIELLPNRGSRVARISEEEIDELFPIMAALEGLAGELAARRIADRELAELRDIHDEMIGKFRRRDEAGYLRLNRRFHERIFELSENQALLALFKQLLARTHQVRFIAKKTPEHWRRAVDEHEKILRALEARQARRVGNLLRAHMMGTGVLIARETLRRDTAIRLGSKAKR